ncbi:hypothetical protein ACSBR1_012145 [Camellia fascicularis]
MRIVKLMKVNMTCYLKLMWIGMWNGGGLMRGNVTDEAGTHEAQVEERWEDESASDELRSIDSSIEGEDNGKKKEKYPNMHTDMVEPQFKVGCCLGLPKPLKMLLDNML